MTVDQWGVYIILSLYLAAFFGSIIKAAHQNNDLKINRETILVIISILALVALITIVAYVFFDKVTYGQSGNVGSFGQSGDYFGGILNPIFGFLTVVLLLLTLNLQRKSNGSTELKNQILVYESIINNRLKDFEEIKTTELLNDLHKEFHDINLHKPDTFYIANVNPKALNNSARITIGVQAEKIYSDEQSTPYVRRRSVTDAYSLNNYNVIWRARKAIKDIRDISVELVKISNDKFYKDYQRSKYYEFVVECSSYGLITVHEMATSFTEPMEKAYR